MEKQVFRVPYVSDFLDELKVPLSPVTRAGDYVFVSGIPPLDTNTMKIERADIAVQTERCMEGVKACLEAAGSSLDKVLKCTIYITNAAYFDALNEVYGRYFPKDPPARTFATVGSWPLPFDIEIECIATV